MSDFRFAFRQLTAAPGFSLVAILTLGLGIGLSTTIFNGVNPLLFRALPFKDPATLVYLNESNQKQGFARMEVSYADYVHWKAENQVFSAVGAWDTTNFTLGGGDQPERLEGCMVTASLLPMLGIAPAAGRTFRTEDEQPGAAPVVLLADGLWERRFASDPSIVGRTVLLNGVARTVIGIMPRGIRFPNHADLWIPAVVEQPEKLHGNFAFAAAARLKPGVTLVQAHADLMAIHERIAQETPLTNANLTPFLRPITDAFLDTELRTMGWTMLGAVAFVLAVACANVASLFLTRALARHREFAIRSALGASRGRTIRQLLVESLLIGSLAGAVGFVLSLWGVGLVTRLVPIEIPYWIDFSVDGRVLAFAVVVSLLTSVVFGLAPAWQAARVDVLAGLNEATRGSSGGRDRARLRRLFVVAEVALATLLLCGTGLMIHSLLNLQRVHPGFNPDNVAVCYLDVASRRDFTPEKRLALYDQFIGALAALPGVKAAAACSSLPLSGSSNEQVYTIEGQPRPADGTAPVGTLRVVSPGYFATMEIPLLAGRDFNASDTATSTKVIIIDAALARRHFGAANPIGQRIRWTFDDAVTSRVIVGVVGDVKHSSLDRESRPGFYLPHAQNPRGYMGIVLRTTSPNPLGVFAAVRGTLRAIDPTLPLFRVNSMRSMINETIWIKRYLGQLMVGFAALALGLAAVGIASVVGYAVNQRTVEIGIRMALGAEPSQVQRMVLTDGMRLVVAGVTLGLVASLGLAQILAAQLYGVSWLDPVTLLASAAALIGVALFACWLPARRATRISPVEALRAE